MSYITALSLKHRDQYLVKQTRIEIIIEESYSKYAFDAKTGYS